MLLLLSSLFVLGSGVQIKPVIDKIIGELLIPVDNRKSKELVQEVDIVGADWHEFQSNYYLYDPLPRTWEVAKAFCQDIGGGNLASITSDDENLFITSLTEGSSVWIGGNDPTNANDWQWSDGSSWEYVNWASATNEPNKWLGNPEDCVELYGSDKSSGDQKGQWNDQMCNFEIGVICKLEISVFLKQ